MVHKQVAPVDHLQDTISACLKDLLPLEIRELNQSAGDLPLFEWLLHRYHYLGHTSPVGLNLKYLVFDLEATRRENDYLRKLIEARAAQEENEAEGAD